MISFLRVYNFIIIESIFVGYVIFIEVNEWVVIGKLGFFTIYVIKWNIILLVIIYYMMEIINNLMFIFFIMNIFLFIRYFMLINHQILRFQCFLYRFHDTYIMLVSIIHRPNIFNVILLINLLLILLHHGILTIKYLVYKPLSWIRHDIHSFHDQRFIFCGLNQDDDNKDLYGKQLLLICTSLFVLIL